MRAEGERSWGSMAINPPKVLIPGAAARSVATLSSRLETVKARLPSRARVDEEL